MPDASSIPLAAGDLGPTPSPLDILQKWQTLSSAKAQQQQTEQETLRSKQALAQTMAIRHAQIMFGLRGLPDDQIEAASHKAVDDEVATGQLSPQQADVFRARLREASGNPKAIRDIMDNGVISNLSAAQQLAAATPHIVDTDVGGGLVSRVTPSPIELLRGAPPTITTAPGGDQPKSISPSEQATQTDRLPTPQEIEEAEKVGITLKPDQPITQSLRQRLVEQGLGDLLFRGDQAARGTTPPRPAGGAVPPGATLTQPTPNVRPQAGLPPGAIITKQAPTTASARAEEATASTQAGVTLTNTDASRPMKFALLNDILASANVPGAFTGPDAPAVKTLIARLSQIPGVVTEDVKRAASAQEQLAKAMANLQTLQMDAMIGTNAGLAHTIDASPHMELSKYGLQGIVHQLQGTFDAQEAMSRAWQEARASGKYLPEQFKEWQSKFLAPSKDGQFDPRVFWIKRMDSREAREFIKASKDPNLDKNFDYAVKQGWITQ